MSASVVVTYRDNVRSRVLACRDADEAREGARTVVYSGDAEVASVAVTEGGREVERWVRDARSGVWRHVAGVVLGGVW